MTTQQPLGQLPAMSVQRSGSPSAAPRRDAHPELPLFAPMTYVPQGDGCYLVRPGKPVEDLTVSQFAAQLGHSSSTIRRYIHAGLIPRKYLSGGRRKWRIAAAAIPECKERFVLAKLDGLCLCGSALEPGKIRCSTCHAAFSAAVSAPTVQSV